MQLYNFFNRNALLTLPESLQHEWRTSFVSDFVMPLRTVYRDVLRKRNYSHFTGICSQGGWTGMIMEVWFQIKISN